MVSRPLLGVAGALLIAIPAAPIDQSRTTFVGTTPCDGVVRAFLGGLPVTATCHAIRWELTLGTAEDVNRWRLTAVYGVPPATNPNAMVDGPSVTKQGTLTRSTVQRLGAASTVFRLTGEKGSSIAFAQVGDDLMNLAREDGALVRGTYGWSYTLTRADRVEPPVLEIVRTPEGSYTIPPKETGSHVFAIFEGRSPAAGLARESKLLGAEGMARLKWRVTLLQDPGTNQPTTYSVNNSLTRERPWTGAWRIIRGAPGFPDASVYQLDGDASHGPILLLRADENLVLFLNQQRQPLPGNADLSYMLTRSDTPDRTSARVAQMTDAQKAHGRLHEHFGGLGKILDRGDSIHSFQVGADDFEPSLKWIRARASSTDTVFVGTVTKRDTFPTETGRMLFTDYQVTVSEVLRRPEGKPTEKEEVTVTVRGGGIDVGSLVVAFTFQGFPQLDTEERFLFFVKRHEDLDVYEAVEKWGMWQLQPPYLINPRPKTSGGSHGARVDGALNAIRRARCR